MVITLSLLWQKANWKKIRKIDDPVVKKARLTQLQTELIQKKEELKGPVLEKLKTDINDDNSLKAEDKKALKDKLELKIDRANISVSGVLYDVNKMLKRL